MPKRITMEELKTAARRLPNPDTALCKHYLVVLPEPMPYTVEAYSADDTVELNWRVAVFHLKRVWDWRSQKYIRYWTLSKETWDDTNTERDA